LIFVIASVVIFFFFIAYQFLRKQFNRVVFFVAVAASFWIVCLPNSSWFNVTNPTIFILTFLKSLFLSLLDVGQLFVLNIDFDKLSMNYHGWKAETFILFWVAFLYLMALLLSFSVIVQFLSNWWLTFKVKYIPCKNNHIFFGDYSQFLSLIDDVAEKKERTIITYKNKLDVPTISNKIIQIPLDYPLKLSDFNKTSKRTNYYLLDGEIESIKLAIDLIRYYGSSKSNDFLYINDPNSFLEDFLKKQQTDTEYLDDERFKVRFLNNERMALYDFFYDNRHLLSKVINDTPHYVVIGDNQLALECVALLSWLSQTFASNIRISCIHSSEKFKTTLYYKMPALFEQFQYESPINFSFFKVPSLTSAAVYEKLKSLGEPTAEFIFMDEVENIDLVRIIKQRVGKDFALIFSLISPFLVKQYKAEYPNNILQLGSFSSSFNTELEMKALTLHKKYEQNFVERSFYNNQYNYYSSMSRALGDYYLNQINTDGETFPESLIMQMEHNRWSVYLKTEGWRYDKNRDDVRKKHNLLVPFEDLSELEQNKDRN
jgi:hypothetical protein